MVVTHRPDRLNDTQATSYRKFMHLKYWEAAHRTRAWLLSSSCRGAGQYTGGDLAPVC